MMELILFWLENGALRTTSKPTFLIHLFTEPSLKGLNQSIKNRMYRWMDTNKTERYIESSESLRERNNNSNHSSIGLPPNVAWNIKLTNLQIREKLQRYLMHSLR